ncbi:MAG: lysylphosphatidylglycerol synthase transmembrane domain-containing protein [Actinomycetota bacterium]
MSQEALVFVANNLNQHANRKLTDSRSGEVAEPEVNTSPETADSGAIPLPPKRRLRRNFLFLIFIGIALYFLLPRLAAMEQSIAVLARLNISFVMLAVAAQVVSYVGSGYLLQSVVRSLTQPVSVFRGALVTLAANSVGTLGGGALGTAGTTYLWLRRHGINRGAAGLGGWIPIFVNLAALAAVSLGGLMVLIHLKKSSTILALGLSLVMLVLLVGLGALGWLLIHRGRLHSWATSTARFAARLLRKRVEPVKIEIAVAHLLEGWDALVQGGWRGAALGAVVNIGGDMLTLSFLFLAAGNRMNAALLLAGYGVPQLVGKLTVILGGAGVVETAMVALYVLLGVPKPTAIVAVLGYRLFSFWLPTVIGIALVPVLGTRGEQTRARETTGA